jgi:nucleoid-associated protein YgaU
MDDIRVLSALLAQSLHAPQPKARVSRRRRMARRSLRFAGAALLVGGTLAVMPAAGILPMTATAAKTDRAGAEVSRRDDLPAPAQWAVVSSARRDELPAPRANESLLYDLLDAPPAPSEMRTMLAQARAPRADTALLYDLLDAPPAPSEMRTLLAQARIAHTGGTLEEAAQPEASENSQALAPVGSGTAELALGLELSIPEAPTSGVAADWALPQSIPSSYVVRSGDSLWAIAERLYGNGALWPAIYHANARIIANPDLIYPDQQFSIPAQPTWPYQPVAYRPPAQHSNWSYGNYTIVSGDTLSDIAYRVYGNANRWPEIYAGNQGAIGGDPDLIFPGTRLNLP